MAEAITKHIVRVREVDVPDLLLRDFRIASSVLCRSAMAPPWGFAVDPRDAGSFHLVLAGGGWMEVDGSDSPIPIGHGDVVVLPKGNGHRVRDSWTSAAPRLASIIDTHPVVDGKLRFGGDAVPTAEIVCGTFAVEGERAPWFERLPPVVITHYAPRSGDWRDALARALRDEARSPTPGGAVVVNRWLESILGDALRIALAEASADRTARPAAVADERIGRVLALVNDDLPARWTLVELADAAAMSRSAFAERFRSLVGEPPGGYVTRVRLDRARRLLRSTNATVADVAARVGYGSEESLSRAFKVRFGVAPSHVRRLPGSA